MVNELYTTVILLYTIVYYCDITVYYGILATAYYSILDISLPLKISPLYFVGVS